jgi:predicted transcriptional regulator
MELKKYLEFTGMSVEELSKIAGVTQPTLYNILLKKEIKLSTALKISRATKLVVKCEDMEPHNNSYL